MIIVVLSCSKNKELFYPFWYCMQKFYPGHPEVVYFTDGIINPFYRTIPIKNMILDKWTVGFREFLNQIPDRTVLIMIDDCFIRQPVNIFEMERAKQILRLESNVACMNFEKSWDENDIETKYRGWKKRQHGSDFEVSLLCGLWNREKLLSILDRDCSPWEIEEHQDGKGYDYFINSGDYIIDWGYRAFQPCGIVKGKWTEECRQFLESQGIKVDYQKKGFINSQIV